MPRRSTHHKRKRHSHTRACHAGDQAHHPRPPAGRADPLTMQVASVCRLDRQVSEGTSQSRRLPSRDRESSRRGAAAVAASSTTSLAWPRSRRITRASTTLITAGRGRRGGG